MKNFIRMKYEQFLMRLFDILIKIMSRTRVDWYPRHVLNMDYIDEIYELEMRNSNLEYHLLSRDERIEELEEALSYYEPMEEEEES